jgi:hypothetical protein
MNVHFILTKGPLHPQYRRAIESAEVHGRPITLWHCDGLPDINMLTNYEQVTCRKLFLPDWLKNQQGCVIYDYLAYKIGYEEGGLLLGLDTLSVRPAFDLLSDDCEVVLSRDVPDCNWTCEHPFNNIFLCHEGSRAARLMMNTAETIIRTGIRSWGTTGPAMLTQFVREYPTVRGAPFPALCGWEGSTIWKFYLGLEKPSPDTRVIHLFSSAYPELFWRGRVDEFRERYPNLVDYDALPTYPYVDPQIYKVN